METRPMTTATYDITQKRHRRYRFLIKMLEDGITNFYTDGLPPSFKAGSAKQQSRMASIADDCFAETDEILGESWYKRSVSINQQPNIFLISFISIHAVS